MDINGDGLQDIVSMKRGSTTIKVKYNKGNSFTDYQIVDIPSWGYTITNNKDAFWNIRHSQGYINGKKFISEDLYEKTCFFIVNGAQPGIKT